MNWQAFDPGLLVPPLLAGVLVLMSHVPLGMQVLARGIVFIDLAVAQVAGLGVIAASLAGFSDHSLARQVAAASAAIAGALVLTWTDRRWPRLQEALIGTVFVLAATAGALLLADHPHGGEHLRDLLVGQVLWVGEAQLLSMAGVSAAVVLLRWLWPGLRHGVGFYLMFALAVTASVQLVGVFLVFSSLILPALAAAGRRPPSAHMLAAAVGGTGYASGLLIAAQFDLPAGPAIVWCMAITALCAAAGSGCLRYIRNREGKQ